MRAEEFTLNESHDCHYVTSCVDCDDVDALEHMIDVSEEITYSEFINYVSEDELAEYFSYNWHDGDDNGLRMEDDYHVSYYTSTYQGTPAVYVRHSGIEYVWSCGYLQEDHPSNINYDKAYDSFVSAEMSGVDKGKDGTGHYIRTHGANKKNDPVGYKKGSSAWGPAQINKVTANDYTTRYPNKFKDQKDYTDKYNTQGGNLLKYGREPNKKGYDARYDYGGKGDLSAPEYHKPYKKMATTMMRQMDHELKSSNPKAGVKDLVKRWRGKGEQDDPRYYDEFFKAYNQQNQK